MGDKRTDNIWLYDGRVDFWKRTAVSYSTLLGCIGIGVLIGSEALQWIGGLLWLLGMIAAAIRSNEKYHKTPQEAADHLLKTYGVKANASS